MKKLRPFLPYLKNKYVFVLLLAGIWILFFDRYYIFGQGKIKSRIHELEQDRNFYKQSCEELKERQAVLDSDPAELEKYAREKYYMKRKDEDIFLVKALNHSEKSVSSGKN